MHDALNTLARRWRLLAVLLLALAAALTSAPSRAQAAAAPFDQQTLDELLAPIALYPDALLTQVLIASTYPLEVVQAARFVDRNRDMASDALAAAAQTQPWDPSVVALVRFPSVLAMMDDKLDWTQKLGDAFVAQQAAVMDTVQSLRARALAAGNLVSNPQQTVVVQDRIIVIEPAQPQFVYVPFFDPRFVYGNWWWGTPPRWVWAPPPWYRPPGWVPGWGPGWGPGIGWGRPVVAPPWVWHGRGPNWHDRNIVINNNNTIIVNNRGPQVWTPDPGPRRGVSRPGGREAFAPNTNLPGTTSGWPGAGPGSRPAPIHPGSMTGNPMMGTPPPASTGPRPGTRPTPPHPAAGGNDAQPHPAHAAPAQGPGAQPPRPNGSPPPGAPPAARPAPRPAAPPAAGDAPADAPRPAPPARGSADRDSGSRPGTSSPPRATP
jgi:hypothetical protein